MMKPAFFPCSSWRMTPRSTARRMVDSSASPSTRDRSSAKSAWFTQSIRSPFGRVDATKLKRCTIDAAGCRA